MRQPPGGVPDVDISADTVFVARVPLRGTCDAGRGFWKKLRHDILSTGLKRKCSHLRTVHIPRTWRTQNPCLRPTSMTCCGATKSGYEDRVQQLFDRYTIKTVESGTFRFCGREVIQHSEQRHRLRRFEPVRYDAKGRKQNGSRS